ncbi:MAG TPA: hypothetical protein VGN57_23165 [Pirellulaceae bacterium]|nr:hypothetical protein [Pirellulaceae bacterium]
MIPRETGPEKAVMETGPEKAVMETGPEKAVMETGPEKAVMETGPEKAVMETGPEKAVIPRETVPEKAAWVPARRTELQPAATAAAELPATETQEATTTSEQVTDRVRPASRRIPTETLRFLSQDRELRPAWPSMLPAMPTTKAIYSEFLRAVPESFI